MAWTDGLAISRTGWLFRGPQSSFKHAKSSSELSVNVILGTQYPLLTLKESGHVHAFIHASM